MKKKIISLIMVLTLTMTILPFMSEDYNLHAATKLTGCNARATGNYSAAITWRNSLSKKQKKKIKGIAVFRNNSMIAVLGKDATAYNDSSLSPGGNYSYHVRAYKTKTKKIKQYRYSNSDTWTTKKLKKYKLYYNKATGQWQKKKPSKKNRGKTQTITVKKRTVKSTTYTWSHYSNASDTQTPILWTVPSPTGFKAEKLAEDRIKCSWNAVSQATKYTCYIDYNGQTIARETTGLFITIGNLPPGTYKCYATASQGSHTSKASNVVTITVSQQTKPDKTVTDYLGITRTFKWYNSYWSCDGGSTRVSDSEMWIYDKTIDGQSGNLIQLSGATFRLDELNSGVYDKGIRYFTGYNVDASKLTYSFGNNIKKKSINTHSWSGQATDHTYIDITKQYLTQNGEIIAMLPESGNPIDVLKYGNAFRVRLRVYSENDSASCTALGDGVGLTNGIFPVTFIYDGKQIGTYTINTCSNAIDGISPRRKIALEIAEKAIAWGKSEAGQAYYNGILPPEGKYRDFLYITDYISNTYYYDEPVTKYGITINMRCNQGAYILETWAIWKYGDEGRGFQGWGSNQNDNDDHVAYHLNSDPNNFVEASGHY